jgi:hypothetical protein
VQFTSIRRRRRPCVDATLAEEAQPGPFRRRLVTPSLPPAPSAPEVFEDDAEDDEALAMRACQKEKTVSRVILRPRCGSELQLK